MLTNDERDALYQNNLVKYHTSRKKILSEENYCKLMDKISEKQIRDNIDSDLTGDILDLDVCDIIDKPVEHLKLFCLDKDKKCFYSKIIAVGNENTVDFDYFEIISVLIAQAPSYFTFVHNHPIAYGAKFSTSDLNMAFNVARIGEMIGIYMDDFAAVTEYDCIKLSSNVPLYREICDFDIFDTQFTQQSLLLSSEPLYQFLNSVRNRRRRENCSFNSTYQPTSESDFEGLKDLFQRLLNHCYDEQLKDKMLEEMEEIIRLRK